MGETVTQPAERREPVLAAPGRYAEFKAATRQLQAVNRNQLLAALDGVQLDAGEQHLLDMLAQFEPATLGAAVQLIERCRAGAGRYTAPLELHADQVDTGYLLLDASNERDWHPITAVLECETDHLVDGSGEPDPDYDGCSVIRSAAYSKGEAHCPADWMLTVRIPAGEER